MGPEELLAGEWMSSCLMLVMPGGADLPYCRQLNGPGNELIRGAQPCCWLNMPSDVGKQSQILTHSTMSAAYVEDGGSYLGLCAGAYYACSYVEFDLGTRCAGRSTCLTSCLLCCHGISIALGGSGWR